MKSFVLGLAALASSVVPGRKGIDGDWHARIAGERQVVLPRGGAADVAADPTAESKGDGQVDQQGEYQPEAEVQAEIEIAAEEEGASATLAPGSWELGCRIKSGSALLFDRASLRGTGGVTLFRWAAPRFSVPSIDEPIYTGVVNCVQKSIEPSWPGKSRDTRAGTCGRGLVEAVCAAAEQADAAAHGHRPTTSDRRTHAH
jgi:hypothetical protein